MVREVGGLVLRSVGHCVGLIWFCQCVGMKQWQLDKEGICWGCVYIMFQKIPHTIPSNLNRSWKIQKKVPFLL